MRFSIVCSLILGQALVAGTALGGVAPPAPPPPDLPASDPAAPRPPLGAAMPASPSLLRGSSMAKGPGGVAVQAPARRFVINNLLVLRLNPVGLEDQMRIGFQMRMRSVPDPASTSFKNLLLRDNFVFFGIAPRFNPAFIKIGPSIEIQPISIFNLRVAAEYIGFFSTFGFLSSYPSATDDYHDKLLSVCSRVNEPGAADQCTYRDAAGQPVIADTKRNYTASGAHVMIEPLVQLKFGPMALRNKLAFEYWYMNVRDGDRVFYDVTLDTLVPTNGWVMANDLDLLYISKFGLTAGVRYSIVKPLYTDNEFRPGEDRTLEDNAQQRLGPIIAYTFFDRGFTRFNRPTVLLIANWYLDHRYRTGNGPALLLGGLAPTAQTQSQGVPYIVVGFSFQSDLLRTR